MSSFQRNLGQWLRNNWLELLLVLVFLAALGWALRTGAALLPQPTPTPSPTATPVATATPQPTPTPSPEPQTFDGRLAQGYVSAQVTLGPRPSGSQANAATADLIAAELARLGWEVEEQAFEREGVPLRNVIGKYGSGDVIILGAHFDTRPAADLDPDPLMQTQPILGANDGASGVAVLLELARSLNKETLRNQVWLAFFDAEDRGRIPSLGSWPFSVGAAYMAENLAIQPQAVIVVDMVGDADQQLYYEANSDEQLRQALWSLGNELGYARWFIPEVRHTIIDDHLPFLERGIPAVDIIDFDYAYWHTTQDTADKVSPDSLERVGRVLEVYLEERAGR